MWILAALILSLCTIFSSACPSNLTILDVASGDTIALGARIVAKRGDVLRATISGSSTPNFLWSVNETAIYSGSDYILSETGSYTLTCVAQLDNSTFCNSTESTSIEVFVIACPSVSITSSTGSQTVVGETSFTCSSTGEFPAATFQWFSGLSQSAVQSEPVFSVRQSGDYNLTCVASVTAGGGSCSKSASVSGKAVECSTVTIASTTGVQTKVGQTVFTCSAPGNSPSPTFQWFSGSSHVQSGPVFSISNTGKYSLTCVSTSTAEGSTCSTNTSVSGSAIACPTAATITSSTGSQHIVGETTLTCSASGGYPNVTYDLNSYPSVIIRQANPVYKLKVAVAFYQMICAATVDDGISSCSVTAVLPINAVACPNVTITKSVTAVPGQTTFDCSSFGEFPAATFEWFDNLSSSLLHSGPQYSVSNSIDYDLRCVATSVNRQSSCSRSSSISGFAAAASETTVAPATFQPTAADGQTTTAQATSASQQETSMTTTAASSLPPATYEASYVQDTSLQPSSSAPQVTSTSQQETTKITSTTSTLPQTTSRENTDTQTTAPPAISLSSARVVTSLIDHTTASTSRSTSPPSVSIAAVTDDKFISSIDTSTGRLTASTSNTQNVTSAAGITSPATTVVTGTIPSVSGIPYSPSTSGNSSDDSQEETDSTSAVSRRTDATVRRTTLSVDENTDKTDDNNSFTTMPLRRRPSQNILVLVLPLVLCLFSLVSIAVCVWCLCGMCREPGAQSVKQGRPSVVQRNFFARAKAYSNQPVSVGVRRV